ncbi:MAG: yycG [Clostridia bacterium]|jgi:signal transduction histidine kinase|nr:yycG [Clostridia bacterium]
MRKYKEMKEKLVKCNKQSHGCHKNFYRGYHGDYRHPRECEQYFQEIQKSKAELHKMHRHARFSPHLILLFNLIIWYMVFKYAGIKEISIFFAVLFTAGGFFEFFFLRKIEKRILTPIDKLKGGIDEISKGNYNIKVETDEHNEISLLIDAFNEMAYRLQESEQIKAEYEENRRMLIVNISHDLKTPITSIQGYIEAITENSALSPKDINKYLKIIHNNTTYINKLIDDLFFFSKLDMQKLEFEFITVSVRPFLGDLMEEFQLEFEEKHIKFDYFDTLKEDCTFNIDRKRLHQVFRNIIGNAEKYGARQDLTIKTRVYKEEQLVCIAISDNGPGIPKDKLTYIFNRFYRIDTERTKDLTSTGLGLAIAKELVEAHGGKIAVSSTENEGTCFTVMLPINEII